MINICFAGVTGWTAPPILAAIDAAEDLTLTSGVSRSAAGQGAVYATGEFIQVHPTAIPGADKLRLISESARGEGG